MKTFIIVFTAAIISCCSSTNTTGNKPAAPGPTSGNVITPIPDCVQKLIARFKAEEKQNPPRQIFSYVYKGETVYYVTPPCCDFFSDLYDSNCKLIGHPDGGITGKGDGSIVDFLETRKDEKLIWKDDRK